MRRERQESTPGGASSGSKILRGETRRERRVFNRAFRENFKSSTRKVEVPGLGRIIKMVDISTSDSKGPNKVVVPGWTESVKILKPVIKAWANHSEHVASYTPGKLLNPNSEDYPQIIWDAIDQMNETHAGSENGRAALASLESHEYFPFHVQRALELLAVINTISTNPEEKMKLHAHSQGLPVATIAALIAPEKIHSILGDAGAGTIGEDKFSRLAGRFTVHLSGSTLRGFKGPKDALRTVRGGIGAVKYLGQNRTKALREAGVIASTNVYPALEYLDARYGIKSILVSPDKDKLYTPGRVKAANSAHAEETGHAVRVHIVKGGHNEVYVRAEKHVPHVAGVWNQQG